MKKVLRMLLVASLVPISICSFSFSSSNIGLAHFQIARYKDFQPFIDPVEV